MRRRHSHTNLHVPHYVCIYIFMIMYNIYTQQTGSHGATMTMNKVGLFYARSAQDLGYCNARLMLVLSLSPSTSYTKLTVCSVCARGFSASW